MKRTMPYLVGVIIGVALALLVAVPIATKRAQRESEAELARKLLILCEMSTPAYKALLESPTNLTDQTVRGLALSHLEAHKETYEDIIAEGLMPTGNVHERSYQEACALLERHGTIQQDN